MAKKNEERRTLGTGSIVEWGAGKFRLKWYAKDGKQHSKIFAGGRRDAEKELRKMLASLDNDTYIKPNKLTVTDLCEKFLSSYTSIDGKDGKVKDTVQDSYIEHCRNHIIPNLGYYDVSKVTTGICQDFLDNLKPVAKGKEKLSPTTCNHIRTRLIQVFNFGIRQELIVKNPAKGTDKAKTETEEMQILDDAELRTLLSACTGNYWDIPIRIAAFTGMRQGEILGLRWNNVNLEKRTIFIERSLSYSKAAKGYKLTDCKTDGSRRTIKVSQMLMEALKKHKAEQDALKEKNATTWIDRNLVCCRDNGEYLCGTNLTRGLQDILETAKIRRIRFHDLRHTHASHLIRSGANIKYISARLGHASTRITWDVYGHLFPQDGDVLVDIFDSILVPPVTSPVE
jgi:integrase